MNELDMTLTPTLTLDVDSDPLKFAVRGGTFVHRERIDAIPGSRFVGKGSDYWTVPLSWVSAKLLRRMFEDGLDWTDNAVQWVTDKWTSQIEPSLELRNVGARAEWIEWVRTQCPPERQPRDYQVAGALFLATAKRAMLLDEQGTGKMTQTALTLMLYPDTLPALIVAPKGTVYTWQRELARFGIASIIIDGSDSKAKRDKMLADFDPLVTPVIITTYSMLPKYSRVAGYGKIKLSETDRQHKEFNQIRWRTVCADEAHRAKEPDTIWTRALWAVSENAEYRWATTGTPTEKDIMDFWSLLHFLDPIEWPASTKFRDLWVLQYNNFFGGIEVVGIRPDVADEFYELTDWHWRRVLKGDDLPPRTFMDVFYHLSPAESKVYKQMEKTLMAEIGGEGWTDVLFAENHMVKAGRLMMACAGTLTFDADDTVRITEPSSKLDALKDRLETHKGKPMILWFKHRDLLHMQEARFDKAEIPYVSIHGDVTGKDRDQAVQDFQDGKVDYILCTIAAASEGVTLTRAPLAIYVQREYSSIMHAQSLDRHHRIGSEIHDSVGVEFIIAQDTVEELLTEQLEEKEERRQELVRD